MSKVAVFLAGDQAIIFPALVAISSIKKNNPGKFDYYVAIDPRHLKFRERLAYKKAGINVIDPSTLRNEYGAGHVPIMKGGRWPEEIMLNWIVPYYLNDMGYEYSIKIDYDILCVAPYVLDEILPKDTVITGLLMGVDVKKEGFSENSFKHLCSKYNPNLGRKNYINAGFVPINNRRYVERDFYNIIKDFYNFVVNLPEEVRLEEQISLCLAISKLDLPPMQLPEEYNARVRNAYICDNDFIPRIKNIHYITKYKPWKSFNPELVRAQTGYNFGAVSIYRGLWLSEASKFSLYKKYCDIPEMTPLQQLGAALNAYKYLFDKK